jgi:hypothetical protein
MIHVLLGRGLLAQDEAFVIGFTMGATKAVSGFERIVRSMALPQRCPQSFPSR